MFVNFFINRPVFSTVCSLLLILVGAVSIPTLATEYYPNVTPPTVSVTANYPGASSEVVETAVTSILERQINGVEGMKYIASSSSSSGTSQITITFDQSRDPDIAAVDVQNLVSEVTSQLPAQVNQNGLTVAKAAAGGSFVLAIGLYSDNNLYSSEFISNYADRYLVDPLKRLPGVATVQVFGERLFAMRIWLDPSLLAARGLTAQDVVNALEDQNLQVGAGQIGAPPAPPGQQYQINVQAVTQLQDVQQFDDMVVKAAPDGTLIRLQDVGRAELGAQDYTTSLRFRGQDGVGLGVSQLTNSNALQVAEEARRALGELSKNFPPGLKYEVAFDTTLAVKASVVEVITTLVEAIGLVVLVIFLFLQDWRTTLIPAITIPVSLVGTFAFIKLFGFSINSLTLFGLVLATGLVVDDAIVVVENVTRVMEERHLNPREAAMESMREVTGAVIATSLVLMAVFIPVSFFPGVTGKLYQQFALTIVFSIGLSVFNALTLTPALSALLLRPAGAEVNWFFRPINWVINLIRRLHRRALQVLVRLRGLVLLVFVGFLVLTYWMFTIVPSGFVPDEDQGYFITIIQSPQGVSIDYTNKILRQVEKKLLAIPETVGTFAVGGFSFFGTGPDKAIIFTTLKPWDERPGRSAQAIIGQVMGEVSTIPGALIFAANPPTIQVGSSLGGFDLQVLDQQNLGLSALAQAVGQLLQQANGSGKLSRVTSPFAINSPQLVVNVDRNKALALGVNLGDIFNTMQIMLGSEYVNNFDMFQRTYKVIVQADQNFRSQPQDITRLYVRSQTGQMIPLSDLVEVTSTTAPQIITHYNLFRSAEVTGSAAPGVSSGQALNLMDQLAKALPRGISTAWTGLSLEQVSAGNQAVYIFALGIVIVFLVLAAQYESYLDPLIIILSVPLAILGALASQLLRGLPDDVFGQIGLVMLIGLASKNAILIVEFANQLRDQGLSIVQAVVQASQERLRPILMTAIAFIVGIFPLALSTGAGANARISLGTTVIGGMLVATFLSLLIVPVIYIVVKTAEGRWGKGLGQKAKEDLVSAGLSKGGGA